MHKLCHKETQLYVPYKAIIGMPSMVLNTDGAVQSHNRDHKMEPLPSRENCYHWKRGICIDEWMIVVILVKNIPEEGSGR